MWSSYPEFTTQGAAQWHRQAAEDRQLFMLRRTRHGPSTRHSRLRQWLAWTWPLGVPEDLGGADDLAASGPRSRRCSAEAHARRSA